MEPKQPTSHRLTAEALDLLAALAQTWGISQTAVLEVMIREKARDEGVKGMRRGVGAPRLTRETGMRDITP
jgi:hypothetical protein